MIRTTIAAAALASAGMGIVMIAPDAQDSTLADGTDFITVDDDTQIDDVLAQVGVLDTDEPAGATVEPVALQAAPDTPTEDASDDDDDAERDGRRRGDRGGRVDR